MKEAQWDEIKKEILGEYADVMAKQREEENADEGEKMEGEEAVDDGVRAVQLNQTINY